MVQVLNVVRMQQRMKKIMLRYTDAEVEVGFTAAYALWVHEAPMKLIGLPRDRSVQLQKGTSKGNSRVVTFGHQAVKPKKVEANIGGKVRKVWKGKGFFWDPQGRAKRKFLEAPARYLKTELGSIVARGLKSGKSMLQSLLVAGLRLQREAQKLVPVDTGNLKNSAFTRGKEV